MTGNKNEKAPTADQLRSRIDSGGMGDKTDHLDLAAAPLGTDDEAAGTRPTPKRRAMSAKPDPSGEEDNVPDKPQSFWGVISVVLAIAVLVLIFTIL